MREERETGVRPGAARVRSAEVVLPCAELQPTLDFFVERLGFRPERISPADDPREAVISGHGLRILLRRGEDMHAGTLRLLCDDPAAIGGGARELRAPNGTLVELVEAELEPVVPPGRQELVLRHLADQGQWVTGRAGMRYRDLIPGRLGGRFIASHIRIPEGGRVPDRVHFHAIRFQLIYCVSGWVRVVYEDQGEPFVLAAGDAVLQPPRIRHRVLECSPGLEVVEVSCPAEHGTFFDHELELPTAVLRPERDFGGQRFVRHVAEKASWTPSELAGFERRDLGIAAATSGLAGVSVVRATSAEAAAQTWRHDGELLFAYVLTGGAQVEGAAPEALRLEPGDSLAVPAGLGCRLSPTTSDLSFLEVRLPG